MSASVARRRREVGDPARERRDQARELGPVTADLVHEQRLGCVRGVVAERFGKQLVRARDVLFAVPEQHARAAIERGARGLGDERGLAQTRLAGDQHGLVPAARSHACERLVDQPDLVVAADDADARPEGETRGQRDDAAVVVGQGLPQHLDRLDGLGQTREREASDGSQLERVAPAGHERHDASHEDLAADALRAEPRRLDHGIAEVVALVGRHLAAAQADPQADRMLLRAVVALDALLHRHRARQRGRRRREHGHHAVAEVLHLTTVVLRERVAQDVEVAVPDTVGLVGREPARERRRADDVGEHQHDALGGHRQPPGDRAEDVERTGKRRVIAADAFDTPCNARRGNDGTSKPHASFNSSVTRNAGRSPLRSQSSNPRSICKPIRAVNRPRPGTTIAAVA